MALVSLPSLMIALLMPCSVVVYRLSELLACSKEIEPLAGSNVLAVPWNCSATSFGQHNSIIVFLRKSLEDCKPRSTPLYLTNICRRKGQRAESEEVE